MFDLIFSVITQTLTFIPLALGISISYSALRATDMTLDGSFVLGAAIFADLTMAGFPPIICMVCALLAGAGAGAFVALIQRGGKVDPLLAGILAMFILTSGNLIIMGRPNISLLSASTLFSDAFLQNELKGWMFVTLYTVGFCAVALLLLASRFGLTLRALGDNPTLLARLGYSIEMYRLSGFALTNTLAAASGALTAQTIGYADIGMGTGMTLTGIGAIILGQQIFRFCEKNKLMRTSHEFFACLLGVIVYFSAINVLLRFDIDPIYLKMILGVLLIFFLRTAIQNKKTGYAQ